MPNPTREAPGTIERKSFQAAEFKAVDAAQGIAEMIVSVFHNTDSMDETILPGFFADSLATRRTPDGRPRVKGVWGHDWLTPIGKTLDAAELLPGDARLPEAIRELGGLWVKGQFNLDTQRGREAFSDLQFGSIDEFSIGYSVQVDQFDRETGIRSLIKGELYEWSPVLVGANPATALLSVKSADPAQLQRALQAAIATPGDPDEQLAAGLAALVTDPEPPLAELDEKADPPPVADPTPADDPTETFVGQAERVQLELASFADRAQSIAALRAKEGRTFSAANVTRLASIADDLGQAAERLRSLIAASEAAEKSRAPDHLRQLIAQFEREDQYYQEVLSFRG